VNIGGQPRENRRVRETRLVGEGLHEIVRAGVPDGEYQLSSTTRLVQKLLYRGRGEPPRPLPVLILLGPVGAGKTHAMQTLSRDCGAGVVHAFFDFERMRADGRHRRAPTTVEVLAQLAFLLSRRWRARPRVRFTRFTLGMVAVDTPLDGLTREQAEDRMRGAIREFAQRPRIAEAVNRFLNPVTDVMMSQLDLVGDSLADTIKKVLPDLVRGAARRRLGHAMRFHSGVDNAEGANHIDALIKLSGLDTAAMTDWLVDAFLADVRADYLRAANVDLRNRCACENPANSRHLHNWVLLLDNVDHPAGDTFVADLLAARERHRQRQPGDHDPLLLVGTSGRWERKWETYWRPPWQAEPDHRTSAPVCRAAGYEHWSGTAADELRRSPFYPVLLEPLTIDETARELGVNRHDPLSQLVHRASGGLPAAVRALAPLVRDAAPVPGARDVFGPPGSAPEPNLWRTRLAGIWRPRATPDGPPTGVDELISAASFATAPWLVPADAESIVTHPRLGQLLTELRTSLWVTAPVDGGATADYAQLHPWLASTLMSALTERTAAQGLPSYAELFTALLEDPDTAGDPVRTAYCMLALGRVGVVVSAFTTTFDTEPHSEWTGRLRLVTQAPDNLPLSRRGAELYDALVTRHVAATAPERDTIGNVVTRLVIATWLAANPVAMPDPVLRDVIADSYLALRRLSRRPDVGDLHD
jgi:hypothetical protein